MARSRSKTRYRARSNPRGVLRVTAAGYGFVQTAEGEFFVPASKMGGAFDGDVVEVSVSHVNEQHPQPHKMHAKRGDKPTARVVRVMERAHETVVGRYEVAEPFGVVVPEDRRIPYDIFTMRADAPYVKDGDAVRVRITAYPTRHTAATGVVEEVLGRAGDDDLAIDLIVARHKLETTFSEAALEEAARAEVDVEGALASGYRDLRERHVFTIDPADARDFDDALSLEPVSPRFASAGEQWRLGVHIADVSHYVPRGSSLDADARRRTTSVYLPDRVIPMLPEALSNGICSLSPGVARRVMTVDLFLDADARLVRFEAYQALIESKERLDYNRAQLALEALREGKSATAAGVSDDTAQRLAPLHRIAEQLRARRVSEGGIEFETVEAKVALDAEGVPVEVSLRQRTDATSLVEEAMILANTAVAGYLREHRAPSLYRVHEAPDAVSLGELAFVLKELGYFETVSFDQFAAGSPHALQAVLDESRGKPECELVSTLLIKSMKRAAYRATCAPHFGLGREAYTHFTSPIRRYPDLVVHRALENCLAGHREGRDEQAESLAWIAEHSSAMERVAEQAAREAQECKLIEYLARFVGTAYSAVISGVASYGIYVRLENTAEGLVPLKELGREYFALDARRHLLVGQDSGKTYRVGQRVAVVLVEADARERKLRFGLAGSRTRH